MEISALFIGLILSLCLFELNSPFALNSSVDGEKQRAGLTKDRTGVGFSTDSSSVKCELQGTIRLPAFSMDGDYFIGGVFSIHYNMHTVKHNYTTMPDPLRCSGRSVRGRCWG